MNINWEDTFASFALACISLLIIFWAFNTYSYFQLHGFISMPIKDTTLVLRKSEYVYFFISGHVLISLFCLYLSTVSFKISKAIS